MLVNGIKIEGKGSLADLVALYAAGADLALVDGVPVENSSWATCCPSEDAEIIFARRGVLPDPDVYQALLLSRNQPGTVEKLAAATVGIAGCGGLGSNAALALARMGIGGLVLADFDVVEPTNLNRQAYFAEDVGKCKVDALHDHIKRVNPVVTIERHNIVLAPDNVAGIFSQCQVILECLDQASVKRMFVETVLAELSAIPLVAASGLGGLGDASAIVTQKVLPKLWMIGDGSSGVGPGTGLAAPRVLIAAGQQALCAARFLTGLAE